VKEDPMINAENEEPKARGKLKRKESQQDWRVACQVRQAPTTGGARSASSLKGAMVRARAAPSNLPQVADLARG